MCSIVIVLSSENSQNLILVILHGCEVTLQFSNNCLESLQPLNSLFVRVDLVVFDVLALDPCHRRHALFSISHILSRNVLREYQVLIPHLFLRPELLLPVQVSLHSPHRKSQLTVGRFVSTSLHPPKSLTNDRNKQIHHNNENEDSREKEHDPLGSINDLVSLRPKVCK